MSCLLQHPQDPFAFSFPSHPLPEQPDWAYMEIDSFKFPLPSQYYANPPLIPPPMATVDTLDTLDTMDTMDTMDIEMDIDLAIEPEPEMSEMINSTPAHEQDTPAILSETDAQPEKVHIRGVDDLTTKDIRQFASEHFSGADPERVEWIDDTSANIVYASADAALQALNSFSESTAEEPNSSSILHLRTAKSLSTHPESILQVRAAVQSDRKKPKAHEASRFYLMHPEHDPRERMRKEFEGGRRQGRRDDSEGEYRRRRYDDREHRRRKDKDRNEAQGFDVNMYDDTPASSRNGDAGFSADEERGRSSRPRRAGRSDEGKELFPDHDRTGGRLRNRTASPTGKSDRESNRRFRDRSRPPAYSARDPHPFPRTNEGKELFSNASLSRELFPDKLAASKLKKELFNQDMTISNHRRSDAFDAAHETADRFAKGMATPMKDGPDNGNNTNGTVELFPEKDLFSNKNRLHIRGSADQGTSIRGAAGLSIKGAASVKELFPNKYGENAGKELFSDKLEGRGGRRRRAEDMFT